MALELILAAERSPFIPFIFSLWKTTTGPPCTTGGWVGEGVGLGDEGSSLPRVPAEERLRPPSPPTFLGTRF